MTPRNEFPRPDFERNHWLSLNGEWDFAFDDLNQGLKDKWYQYPNFPLKITVPFAFQSEASGIHDLKFHDYVWYKRDFTLPKEGYGKHTVLHVGACDYYSEVYINGEKACSHEGGNTSFQCDITHFLHEGNNRIVLYVFDPSTDEFIPRGKQYWKEQHESIWYPRTTGLWQPIWLEFVNQYHIESLRLTPNIDLGNVFAQVSVNLEKSLILETLITTSDGSVVIHQTNDICKSGSYTYDIFKKQIFKSNTHHHGLLWSPESPNLFNIILILKDENTIYDTIKSYFGMRKIHAKDGIIYLNNRPYYQKLILDQGYYPKGLLTALKDEDFIQDIELAKSMGFNGCRKHQVVSDPRFLYHADRLGFIVWGEMANAANYSQEYVRRITTEWIDVINRDYNHPSIVAWVPLNESWGVPMINTDLYQQAHSIQLYQLTKSLDQTRLVASNDGWEQTVTDFCGVHNYAHGNEHELEKQQHFALSLKTKEGMIHSLPAGRNIYAEGYHYANEPILLTEFGGIAYSKSTGWGYTEVKSGEELLQQYERMIEAIKASNCIRGYCYTQLTDVFQEQNGLLTFDRKPKVDIDKIRKMNEFKPNAFRKI